MGTLRRRSALQCLCRAPSVNGPLALGVRSDRIASCSMESSRVLLYRARRWLVQRPLIVKGRQRRYADFVVRCGILPEHSIVDVGSGPEGVSGTLGQVERPESNRRP